MPLPSPSDSDCMGECIEILSSEHPEWDHDQVVAACMNNCEKAMPKKVYKAGLQSESNPYEFVMSTPARDSYGDIVEADWDLKDFKKNPIALWAHNSREPIGVWKKVRLEGERLIGTLELAEKGTSELIDRLRSLIEQRILRAVSVGFIPGEYEAIDEEKPWNGYRLWKNKLFECSLCSVPANSEALSTAKVLQVAGLMRPTKFAEFIAEPGEEDQCYKSVADQISRGSEPYTKPTIGVKPMPQSLSEKIAAKKELISEKKQQLSAIAESENITEEQQVEMAELSRSIDAENASLDILLGAEKSLMVKAEKVAEKPKKQASGQHAPFALAKPVRPKGHKAIAVFTSLVKAHTDRVGAVEIAKVAYPDEPEIEFLVRAATDPATMTDATWAAPLVRETWGEFLELIRDISVYPLLPGMRLEFDRYGKITIPKNDGRGALAGGFVAEGAPIPVKEGVYGSTDLTPKKLAVISSFTREIGQHSIPAIQGLIQQQMLADTAEVLDVLYLDANARDTTRPAGMQDATETGAANINASSGATVANIIADAEAMIGRIMTARAGNTAVWIMNPLNMLKLSNKQDAASGEFVFRAEVNGGRFMGYPVVASQNVPVDLLVLQSDQAVNYGNDFAPTIEVSDQATLVYDDTAPEDINGTAMPTKSMFQTDSIAVKMRAGLDWRIVRQGGVQVLTGVAW